MSDLTVALFTSDVATARRKVISLGLFPAHGIRLADEIAAD